MKQRTQFDRLHLHEPRPLAEATIAHNSRSYSRQSQYEFGGRMPAVSGH